MGKCLLRTLVVFVERIANTTRNSLWAVLDDHPLVMDFSRDHEVRSPLSFVYLIREP